MFICLLSYVWFAVWLGMFANVCMPQHMGSTGQGTRVAQATAYR